MKIGIDIRTLMDARYSGVSEYTLSLIKEILRLASASSAQGVGNEQAEDKFLLFYNSFGDCPNLPKFTEKNVKLVKYNYPNKILNYLYFKFLNWPEIDKRLGVDIFFMPHINFIGLSGATKSLITIHDLSFLRYPEFFSARKNFWHRMVNVKKLVKRFDTVVAVSENTKRDIVELCGVDENRVKVIYAGVGEKYRKINFPSLAKASEDKQFSIFLATPDLAKPDNFQSIFNSQISKLNTDEQKLVDVKNKYFLPDKFILYLGTIEPRKNVDGIIRAYGEMRKNNLQLANVKLVIAGGRGWKSDNIYKEWEQSEFKDDIKFLDYVNGEDKVYLYNLASVFIYPSFYEGFGLPPLEAMACGLPVVTSYASSLPEVVGDAGLMVDPYNIGDLARGLTEILIDGNLRDKLISRGLEQAKKFSWQKTAQEYLEILNRL